MIENGWYAVKTNQPTNLGPYCHLFQEYTNIIPNTEIKILYQNILKLWDKKVISIKPEFRDLLK